MKLELPKVTLESSDISRLHDLLGMAWRADGSSQSPDGQTSRAERDGPIYKQYQTLAVEVMKAAELIAQDAFAAGVQYSRQNVD
jgi:hypothetical protein